MQSSAHTINSNNPLCLLYRSVLTKAELEGLPLDGSLKEDVEKGKVTKSILERIIWKAVKF
jgi:hypothetical protein